MCSVSFFLCGDTSMSFVFQTVFRMVIGIFEILSFSCIREVSDGGQILQNLLCNIFTIFEVFCIPTMFQALFQGSQGG